METEGKSLAESARRFHEVLRIYRGPVFQYRKRVTSPLFPSNRCRFFARVAAGSLGCLAGTFLWGGCASYSERAKAEMLSRSAPSVTTVPASMVVTAAERAAARQEGDFVLQGQGESMAPYYGSGTAIVVHPTSFFMLRAGMPIVYRNHAGRAVAHVLLERNHEGWVAIGLNNSAPDGDIVTPNNLVGVIKYAFAADTGHVRSEGAIAFQDTVASGGG